MRSPGTTGAASNPVDPVNVPATVSAVLTRTATFEEYEGISFAVFIDEVKKHLHTLAADQNTLAQISGKFWASYNEDCQYSLRVPSEWRNAGEDARCRVSLERYEGDDRAGVIYVWDYPLNDGETLDDFSAWWSETLEERGRGWKSFTIIHSEI